ncbi:hypothetical protein CTEN210_09169 [Chaetoceros tenuissimus]|uniref:Uncharacterized protein n=1 Tax=Chaetoceros tenuissimus TaxID=426638 RepID=A0AAD3CVF0_9STRA|nr:hypothetical protein CTEN210_09169 [Chaetoceros tenuissimus]
MNSSRYGTTKSLRHPQHHLRLGHVHRLNTSAVMGFINCCFKKPMEQNVTNKAAADDDTYQQYEYEDQESITEVDEIQPIEDEIHSHKIGSRQEMEDFITSCLSSNKDRKESTKVKEPLNETSFLNQALDAFKFRSEATKEERKEASEALGVSVDYLNTIWKQEIKSLFTKEQIDTFRMKFNEDIENEANMYHICDPLIKEKSRSIICPRDEQEGAAFVDSLDGIHVGQANLMISYAWGNNAGEISDILMNYCMENRLDPKRTFVWICCLCNNQHRFDTDSAMTFDELEMIFGEKVKSIGSVVALLSPWDSPLNIKRIWCVFEIHQAYKRDDSILHFGLPKEEESRMFEALKSGKVEKLYDVMSNIDINNAEASIEQDKDNIMCLVNQEGGTGHLNYEVRAILRRWVHKKIDEIVKREEMLSANVDTDLDLASLFDSVGSLFWQEGDSTSALLYIQKSSDIRMKVLEPNDYRLAESYNNLALVYQMKGDYEKGLLYNSKARKIREEKFDSKPLPLAQSFQNIGNCYECKGEYKKALNFHRKCVVIRENNLDKRHPLVATSYHNIGKCYQQIGEYELSLEYFEKGKDIRRIALGESHPVLASSILSIGNIYYIKNELDLARTNYNQCLQIQKESLGLKHPALASTYNSLGQTFKKQGNSKSAFMNFSNALEIADESLGKNHPLYAMICLNLGQLCKDSNDDEDALLFFQKSQMIQEETLGNHPDLAKTYHEMASIYRKVGDCQKALAYHKKALEIRKETLHKNHPELAQSYNNLGRCYLSKGMYDVALNHFVKALEIYETNTDTGRELLTNVYLNMGLTLNIKGKYDESIDYYKKALTLQQLQFGEKDMTCSSTCKSLSICYRDIGEYDLAMKYASKVEEIYKENLDEEHNYVADSYYDKALLYRCGLQDRESAHTYYQKAYNIYESIYGADHEKSKRCMEGIGYCKSLTSFRNSIESNSWTLLFGDSSSSEK